jgi:hypothetical protein
VRMASRSHAEFVGPPCRTPGPFKRRFPETPYNFITPLLRHSVASSLLLIGLVMAKSHAARYLGGVVEWLMAPVLKTGRAQALVGSNPTPSAARAKVIGEK